MKMNITEDNDKYEFRKEYAIFFHFIEQLHNKKENEG